MVITEWLKSDNQITRKPFDREYSFIGGKVYLNGIMYSFSLLSINKNPTANQENYTAGYERIVITQKTHLQ